ncbi:MAG: glutaredoxin domain-containing protein [Rhodococcus sp. (in: high G+C Gram-positive bacteria)]
MSSSTFVDGIEVLWRPGCPFCAKLRLGLARRGITTTNVDIWAEPDAAARVRAVAGGNETVPTVFVGDTALVNPSVEQVIAAVQRELPERSGELVPKRSGRSLRGMFGRGKRS